MNIPSSSSSPKSPNRKISDSEFQEIMNKLEQIDEKLAKMIEKKEKENQKPEKMLDNTDMCLLLGITKRTLQRYRQKGVVPYYMMKGKPYYKPEEVQEALKRIVKDNRKSS